MTISKPYPHGAMWRCRKRTESGWRWCASASTPEQATAIARGDVAGKATSKVQDVGPSITSHVQDTAATSPNLERANQDQRTGSVKIEGPYSHRSGYRCRIVTAAGRQWAAVAKTEAQALKLAEAAAAKHAKQGRLTVRAALDAYLEYKEKVGARQQTVGGARNAVTALFYGLLGSPVGRITPRVCQEQYDKLRESVVARTGKQISVATHRSYLLVSGTFMRWVVQRGWIPANPLERVRGVGRRKQGKPQMGLEETFRYIESCLGLASSGDDGAIAVLLAICLGLRAGEVVSRAVRDIDTVRGVGGDATILRICDNESLAFLTKNESSKRALEIPDFLMPGITKMVEGKLPIEPLFRSESGRRRCRQWLNKQVARTCKLAGVPVVCPHSLRGTLATGAAASGVRLDLISAVLGHSNSRMTTQHYIKPGTLQSANLSQGLLAMTQRLQQPSPPS